MTKLNTVWPIGNKITVSYNTLKKRFDLLSNRHFNASLLSFVFGKKRRRKENTSYLAERKLFLFCFCSHPGDGTSHVTQNLGSDIVHSSWPLLHFNPPPSAFCLCSNSRSAGKTLQKEKKNNHFPCLCPCRGKQNILHICSMTFYTVYMYSTMQYTV